MRALALGGVVVVGCAGAVYLALAPGGDQVLARYSTTLQGRTTEQRHNAELSLGRLKGAVVEPGAEFSFNARVGTLSRDMGYRKAPVSYNGTLIDTWGGGVCQTSTTLYNAAMLAGLDLVERNRHRFAPSYCPPGRDAAVAFDSIDLRIRNPYPYPLKIQGRIEGDRLLVEVVGAAKPKEKPAIVSEVRQVIEPQAFAIRRGGENGRIRNNGKRGYEVVTYRVWKDRRELLSVDSYPAMHRVVEYR